MSCIEREWGPMPQGTGQVLRLWMNRPERHNAFDEHLISELTAVCLEVAMAVRSGTGAPRAVVLGGRGRSFSAGADLEWMRRQGSAPPAENRADAARLGEMFRLLATLPVPVIARVHGAALGGGMGLAAACTICVASSAARFATTEVRLGLIPAVIGPYVVQAIGSRQALRYFQTAESIDAARALQLGLAHEVVAPEALDACVDQILTALAAGGPAAQGAAVELIRALGARAPDADIIALTAERIAALRATPEAREGLTAFLERRPPSWLSASTPPAPVRQED